MRKNSILKYVLLLGALAHPTHSWAENLILPTIVHAPGTQKRLTLPLRLFRGYLIVVEGSIGKRQKLRFLLDTGSYPSVLDRTLAERLGLEQSDVGKVDLVDQSLSAKGVVLPSLQIGPLFVESQHVLVQDLLFTQKIFGFKVDAIIGLDVLKHRSFTINYGAKELSFGTAERLRHAAAFEVDPAYFSVRMELPHQSLRLLIDTGEYAITLFRTRLPGSGSFQSIGREVVRNIAGEFEREKVILPKARLGDGTVHPGIAFIVNDKVDDIRSFDGVLGPGSLKFDKISFDFEMRTFGWE